jgi:acyl carrier protein
MNKTDARTLVLDVLSGISPEADLAGLRDNAVLRDELDLDSMDFLNFITFMHQRTGIDIPEADYPKLATLDGAIAYLSRPAVQ